MKSFLRPRPLMTLLIATYQFFLLLALTVFRPVIILASANERPPMTMEYWTWFLDEYQSGIPYESTIVSFAFFFSSLALFVFCVGCLLLLLRNWKLGKRQFLQSGLLITLGVILRYVLLVYTRGYGQPYYLFYKLFPGEIACIVFLLLFRINQKAVLPVQK